MPKAGIICTKLPTKNYITIIRKTVIRSIEPPLLAMCCYAYHPMACYEMVCFRCQHRTAAKGLITDVQTVCLLAVAVRGKKKIKKRREGKFFFLGRQKSTLFLQFWSAGWLGVAAKCVCFSCGSCLLFCVFKLSFRY